MGKINLLVVTPILPPQIGGPTTYISGLIENLPKNPNDHPLEDAAILSVEIK